MYFLSRTNKLYSTVIRIKPIYRYTMSLAVVVASVHGWLSFFYFPNESHIHRHQKMIAQLHEQDLKITPSKHACTDLEQSVKVLHNSLQTYVGQGAIEDASQSTIFFIVDHVKQAGLTLNTCSADSHVGSRKNSIALTMTGSLANTERFLQSLKKSSHPMCVDRMQISHQRNNLYNISCTFK